MAENFSNDPTMEDILASIRRIIAAEDTDDSRPAPSADAAPRRTPPSPGLGAAEDDDEFLRPFGRRFDMQTTPGQTEGSPTNPFDVGVYGDSFDDETEGDFHTDHTDYYDGDAGGFRRDPQRPADSHDSEAVLDATLRSVEQARLGVDDILDSPSHDTGPLDTDTVITRMGGVERSGDPAKGPAHVNEDDAAYVRDLGAASLHEDVQLQRVRARAAAAAAEPAFPEAPYDDDETMDLTDRFDPAAKTQGDMESLQSMVRHRLEHDRVPRAPEPPLLSHEGQQRTDAALAQLNAFGPTDEDSGEMRVYSGTPVSERPNSPTVEQLTERVLRSILQDWVNDNLPPMVERLVRQEVERMAIRAQRARAAAQDEDQGPL